MSLESKLVAAPTSSKEGKATSTRAYRSARVGPPGSESTACSEGSPRNLGDPVVSVETSDIGGIA